MIPDLKDALRPIVAELVAELARPPANDVDALTVAHYARRWSISESSETVLIGGAVGYENAALCGSREVIDYVSAAHPGAVLALVAQVKAAQARIAQLEAELDERDQAAMERDR